MEEGNRGEGARLRERRKHGREREDFCKLQEKTKEGNNFKSKGQRKTERKREHCHRSISCLGFLSLHEKQQSWGIFKFLMGCGNSVQALVGTQTSPSDCWDGWVCTSVFSELRRTERQSVLSQACGEQVSRGQLRFCLLVCCAITA